MSFLFRGNGAKNPATYLFIGLFPNLSRYLSGRPRYTTQQLAQATSSTVSTKAQDVTVSDNGALREQGSLKKGVTKAAIEKAAPRFISPHPLVNFAEVPAICRVHSGDLVVGHVFNPQQPLFLCEAVSPSPKFSEVEAESSSTGGSFSTPTQALSTFQQSSGVGTEPLSAEGSFDRPAQSWRPDLSAGFGFESGKCLNRHSILSFPLSHSRNISTSSNETLVWNPNDQSSTPSPVTSEFGNVLQDTAEKIIHEEQADEIHRLEETVEELRVELADQAEQAKELEIDMGICERNRELSFNTALRLYRNPGISVLVERHNLIDQIDQLRFEVRNRDAQIWLRDQCIETLRLDVALYANKEHWIRLQQCYYALQQQYGQMPQDFKKLEQKYEDLEDEHIDVANRLKKLEADHTELKAQHNQIRNERDRLEDDAEKSARAHEQFLAGLAARMFQRIIFMTGVLNNMDVDSMDNEQRALCQLAYEHLGPDATESATSCENTGANGCAEVEEERESGVPETHVGDVPSLVSTSESNDRESTLPSAGADGSSTSAKFDLRDMSESPNTFDARRRREVAAAEDKILGPLGLVFENGSPTLKSKPISEGSKSSKVSRVTSRFPNSPSTPSKTLRALLTSGADDIDQVTPARTGGTSGIARDQWEIAGNELQGFTEVFRGPRAQPIDLVSPRVGWKEAEDDGRFKEDNFSQVSEENAFLSTNESCMHDNCLVEEMEVGSDLDDAEDGAVLEGDDDKTGGSREESGDEDSRRDTAAVLNQSTDSGGHERGFGGGKLEQESLDYENPLITSPAAALKPETSVGFSTFKSFPRIRLMEGSSVFHDLGVRNEAIHKEAYAIASLPKEAFNAPQFQNFNFGGSSGGVRFIGHETKSLPPQGPTSEPTSIGLFNFSNTLIAQAPRTACDPLPFQQDFNFGGSNGGVSFTANELRSSNLPAAATVLGLAGASSVVGTSLAQKIPSVLAQAEEKAPKEEISNNATVENHGTEEDALAPSTPKQKKAKGKKAKEAAPKNEEPKVEGPNRAQRRAASRERKAAEKKAKAVANDATRRGRSAVAAAMMRG
ncbi:hypothetical protein HO173_012276 [Letharia columbiana]|uniref:Uncharacterized protein n=1 Tax=Letharia columbiana TaxID=112416 RepID=A0A8H6CNI4_9LECA|nr:uncharacterized protein HO173_012276 [Letharia columbiana]KAF6226772.1 hypothetical protein HO173_012276 [Letharia columbiana]